MKKLTALLLALIMVLAMNATAFADTTIPTAGVLGDASATTNIASFSFNVLLNKKPGVNSPAETVDFVIAPAAITDVANPYQVGPDDGVVYTATATFPVNPTDAQCTQTVTIDTNKDKFSAPGIYRYEINETVNKKDLGFNSSDATKKYIDVYVKKDPTNGLVIYAVTMGATLTDPDKTLQSKDGDFNIVYTTDTNGNTDTTDDSPKSYDVTINKVLGTSGAEDPNQDFTFNLKVKGLDDAAGVKITVDQHLTTAGTAEIVLKDTDEVYTYTIRGGESFTLKGLPKTLALELVETIAGVGGYSAAATVDNMDTVTVTPGKDTATAKGTVSGENGAMTITNTRSTISPTGVVLRIAPYAIMLGAGVVLFIILKSRKNKAVEEA
jgi:hypothetical protein